MKKKPRQYVIIFERYIDGIGGRAIARELDELGYKTPRGLDHWQDTTVLGIIKNEKYKGDILMGKTFTVDPISKRRLINFGEEDKYYIKNNHDAIISPEILHRRKKLDYGDQETKKPQQIQKVNEKDIQECTLLAVNWNVVFVVLFCLEEVGTLVQSTKRLFGTVQHL